MKKFIYIAALATLVFASCAKDNKTVEVNADKQITFTAVTGVVRNAHTKVWENGEGLIDSTAYPKGETFGSMAYYLPLGKTWEADSLESSMFIDHSEVAYDSSLNSFTTSKAYYWPVDGGSLTFFSYSPYDELHGNVEFDRTVLNGVKINNWNAEEHPNVDVMIADVARDYTQNSQKTYMGVITQFHHKLARISGFRVSYQTEADSVGQTYTINEIVIKNQYTEGSYDGSEWTAEGERKDSTILYTGNQTVTKEVVKIGDEYVVIPQGTATDEDGNITFEVTYTVTSGDTEITVTKEVTVNVLNEEFEEGKSYTYNIIFDLDGNEYKKDPDTGKDVLVSTNRILWSPEVTEWEEQTLPADDDKDEEGND